MYKKFVILTLITLLAVGPIGQFILFKFTPLYNLNLKTKLYDSATWVQGNPKVAIMGTSHARYQIIPDEIIKLNSQYKRGDVVNVGENAASPFSMYHTFIKNKEKFKKLKYLFYTLEPHVLGEKYFLYYDYEKIMLSYQQWEYLEEKNNKQNEYFFPFQTFIKSLKFEQANRSKTYGYSELKHKNFQPYSKGNIARQLFEPLELFPISKFEIEYLKKLKEAVEKNGTQFIFVLTPSYSWYKFYKLEAKEYDTQLVNLLNAKIGKSIVIGSFYPEDYNLKYDDFKDDTHLANTGAIKFTKWLFSNIDTIQNLKKEDFKNTFLYREKYNVKSTKKLFKQNILASSLQWQGSNSYNAKIKNSEFIYSENNFNKFSKLYTHLYAKNIDSINLEIKLPIENLKMISITMNNKTGYAHFFLKPNNFKSGKIILDKSTISKFSNGFQFGIMNSLTIRCYPIEGRQITNLSIDSIVINTFKE